MIHHSGVSLEIIAWRKLGGDFNPFEKHIQLGNLPQQRDENQGTYIPKVNHQLEIPYIEVFKRLSDLTWVLKKLLSEIFPFTTTRRHRHLVIQRNRGKSKPRCSPPPSRCKVTAEVKKKGLWKRCAKSIVWCSRFSFDVFLCIRSWRWFLTTSKLQPKTPLTSMPS